MATPAEVVIKKDVFGSTLTDGIHSNWNDRAVRRFHISNLDNRSPTPQQEANTDLIDAVNAILAQVGRFHHQITDLPLHRVHVFKDGPNTAVAQLIYQRTRFGGFDNPSFTTLANFRDGFEPIQVYRTTINRTNPDALEEFSDAGLPNGIFPGQGPTFLSVALEPEPKPYTFNKGVIKVYVPFDLAFNPYAEYWEVLHTTNASAVTFGGYDFSSNTVRFDAMPCDAYRIPGVPVGYRGSYEFTLSAGGFRGQWLIKSSDGSYWDTLERDLHPRKPWPGFAV